MLRFKVNRHNTVASYKDLTVDSGQTHSVSDAEGTLRIYTTDHVNTFHNPSVAFIRQDGEISFKDSRKIVGKLDGGYVDTEMFPQVRVYIDSAELVGLKKNPTDFERTFVKIKLTGPHNNLIDWRRSGITINEVMLSPESFSSEYAPKRCRGDFFLYENFLYEIRTVSNGQYRFSDAKLLNSMQRMTVYSDHFDAGSATITCIVPIDPNANDIPDTLLWEVTSYGSEIKEVLVNGWYNEILIDDCRFYERTENGDSGRVYVKTRPGTRICLESGNLRVSVPIAEDFATNLYTENAFEEFGKARADAVVNKIVDYEKMKFTPCYLDNGQIKLYNSIKFNIHLRNRVKDEEWKVTDDQMWYDQGFAHEADLVSALDFDDADIYYQKSKVKNTFLRLSFYNSNDRRTQQLLYSAKIYLDSGKLFGKFIKDAENRDKVEEIVDDYDVEEPLYLDFTCSSSFDTGNTSEGFYLYLFPSNLNEGDTGIIYMKVELNNSKYGYTVPLTLPRDASGNIIAPPKHYIKTSSGRKSPDMKRFNYDTFVPIEIFKNWDDKRYYWRFGCNSCPVGVSNTEDDLTVALYEPRMNGTEAVTSFNVPEVNETRGISNPYTVLEATGMATEDESEPIYIRGTVVNVEESYGDNPCDGIATFTIENIGTGRKNGSDSRRIVVYQALYLENRPYNDLYDSLDINTGDIVVVYGRLKYKGWDVAEKDDNEDVIKSGGTVNLVSGYLHSINGEIHNGGSGGGSTCWSESCYDCGPHCDPYCSADEDPELCPSETSPCVDDCSLDGECRFDCIADGTCTREVVCDLDELPCARDCSSECGCDSQCSECGSDCPAYEEPPVIPIANRIPIYIHFYQEEE